MTDIMLNGVRPHPKAWKHYLILPYIFCIFVLVKKVLSIIIMLQLLSNQEALAEITKLPFLFHHYSETEHQHSFIEFLTEHYSGDEHHGDDHEHGKLPFKHSDDGNGHHATIQIWGYENSPVNTLEIKVPVISHEKYFITNECHFPSYSSNIWQPPKNS